MEWCENLNPLESILCVVLMILIICIWCFNYVHTQCLKIISHSFKYCISSTTSFAPHSFVLDIEMLLKSDAIRHFSFWIWLFMDWCQSLLLFSSRLTIYFHHQNILSLLIPHLTSLTIPASRTSFILDAIPDHSFQTNSLGCFLATLLL